MECHLPATHDRPTCTAGARRRDLRRTAAARPSRRSLGSSIAWSPSAETDGPIGMALSPRTGCAASVRAGEPRRSAAAVTWVTACRTQLAWPPRDIRARGEGTSYASVRKDVLSLSARIDLGSWKQPGVIEPGTPTAHRAPASVTSPSCARRTLECSPSRSPPCTLQSGDRTQVISTDEVLEEALALCAFAIERWAETVAQPQL